MATLTNTARTILKSRLRRFNDMLILAQWIEAQYGKTNVSDLTSQQIVDAANEFRVAVPRPDECDAFDRCKASGADTPLAMAAADSFVTNANFRSVGQPAPKAAASVLGTDNDPDAPDTMNADNVDNAGTMDADMQRLSKTPINPTQPDAPKVDPSVIEAEVKSVMALMGSGDFQGYQNRLKDLAARAHTPRVVEVERVVEVIKPAVDMSKLHGYVAKVTGRKTAKEVGLPASLSGVAQSATDLPVYDAPNAPRIDKTYRWHDQTLIALSVMRRGQPVFVTGPAGTGKTEFAKQIAARWGRPFVRISCDDQTEAQTLMGMTVPSKSGGVVWQDGQLTAAIRRPGTVILIDEPSVARPGALMVLQAVMDGDKTLHIAETGESVPVAPDVIILLADNTNGTGDMSGQYEGTRRLNRATLDRPDVFLMFDYLAPTDEAQVLTAKTGLDRKAAAMLTKFAALTRAKANDGKLSHGVGMRRLLALAALLNDGADPATAFQLSVIEGAPYDDREPLRQMWTADVNMTALGEAAQGKAAA